MRQFPAFFQMDDARVVLFGAGEEALRKIRLLARTPAQISVVSEHAPDALAAEFPDRFEHVRPDAAATVLRGARLAIIALGDTAAVEAALSQVREAGVPVNVVDRPELCDFTVPAIIDRGEIVAAIGSGGAAPVLAKSVRARLEALLPARIGELAALARRLRSDVKAKLNTGEARRRFWEAALTGPAAGRAYAGDMAGAAGGFGAGHAAAADDMNGGPGHGGLGCPGRNFQRKGPGYRKSPRALPKNRIGGKLSRRR